MAGIAETSTKPNAAEEYWRRQLEGAERSVIAAGGPTTPSDVSQERHTRNQTIPFSLEGSESGITKSTILRAAWALVLSRHGNSSNICFGATVSGRQAPQYATQQLTGPTLATLPVHIYVDPRKDVTAFLLEVQAQELRMAEFEQYGLSNIAQLSPHAKHLCDFSSLLVIRPAEPMSVVNEQRGDLLSTHIQQDKPRDHLNYQFNYPLVAQMSIAENTIELLLNYAIDSHSETLVDAIAHQFNAVIQQLSLQDGRLIQTIDLVGPWDIENAIKWSKTAPETRPGCIMDVISSSALLTPNDVAVVASDGALSYGELEHMSNKLACHLRYDFGVRSETMIPTSFEKSIWAVIGMLGVMKAGGVYVPIDPSHPTERQRAIIEQTGQSRVMVASPNTSSLYEGLVDQVIELSASYLSSLPRNGGWQPQRIPSPAPKDAAYVIFTSGTTGKPKGIIVEHSSLYTSVLSMVGTYNLTAHSRVLQFSSYVFDGALFEILGTLSSRGVVCVPSDLERLQNIVQFISATEVNTAFLTPSFASTLDPHQMPTLEKLLVGGEPLPKDIISRWYEKVILMNVYGPTETSIMCTSHTYQSQEESPLKLGKCFSCDSWIVEPDNHQQLTPFGCVGELLLQGDVVARGYLNNDDATRKVFFSSSEFTWSTASTRLYKTGDLVRRNSDGSFEFVRRKDTQVKIRGQRIEAGEIEHSIKLALCGVEHVAVEVIRRNQRDVLVAFLSFALPAAKSDEQSHERTVDHFIPISGSRQADIDMLYTTLKSKLPSYMVPSLLLLVRRMPFTISAKLDRKLLRQLAEGLSYEEMASISSVGGEKQAPITDIEFTLRRLWSQVLHVKTEDIGREDSFLQIGGDSIGAIRLVALASNENIRLSVAKIFQGPRLFEMAEAATAMQTAAVADMESTSLLPAGQNRSTMRLIKELCNLAPGAIVEDAYPCTSLQEGLMVLGSKEPGSYVGRYVYNLKDDIDLTRFKAAWNQTFQLCGNLRTRIVSCNGTAIQAVVREDPTWEDHHDLDVRSLMNTIQNTSMSYGDRLCRFAIVQDSTTITTTFVLVMHHAIYDGWSYRIILDILDRVYRGMAPPPLAPYSNFIKYTLEMDERAAADFWNTQLASATPATFPSHSRQPSRNGRHIIRKQLSIPSTSDTSITRATLLRSAWGLLLGVYSRTDDICFGTSVSGRQAPVIDVDKILGPAIATVPVRFKINHQETIASFLQECQRNATDMIPFEQYGLQRISRLGAKAKDACDFSSLLVIQPADLLRNAEGRVGSLFKPIREGQYTIEEAGEGYFTYPLVVQCSLDGDFVELIVSYDDLVLSTEQIHALCDHYDRVLQHLDPTSTSPLRSISAVGDWDLKRAAELNNEDDTKIMSTCLHDLVTHQARLRPAAPALHACDATLTYSELDTLANHLAHFLVSTKGVRIGDLVLLCFEKSAWFYVSLLAVNKAGAAWVPMDPHHPRARHEQILKQTNAGIALVSASNATVFTGLAIDTVEITQQLLKSLAASGQTTAHAPFTHLSPDLAAYVLFTSGTTGTPKGLVMQHQAVCTSQTSISRRLGLTPDVRILQFASYVFDLCIGEIVAPLISGACVCAPADDVRLNNLEEYVCEQEITWAFLTPALARTLDPAALPTLQLLLLAGEAVGQDILQTWVGHVRLINGWGPAETCCFSTLHEWHSADDSPLTIGTPVGGKCWIVDPEDPVRLAPIGCMGEVVIQGPTILREYLANSKATEAQMVRSLPAWMPLRDMPGWDRAFKSGDLCSYNSDGTIEFHSRKDTQVKIRGLRVELGEIEGCIRQMRPEVKQVAVDTLQTDSAVLLVAYLCFKSERSNIPTTETECTSSNTFLPVDGQMLDELSFICGRLKVMLPEYMVPTLFIPCRQMPLNLSTKLDRKALRQMASKLAHEEVTMYSLQNSAKCSPETVMERTLQNLWAEVLHIPAESISRDDSFFRIGGDSIAVIRLVSLARSTGIRLVVKDVFREPQLRSVAANAVDLRSSKFGTSDALTPLEYRPFSLLKHWTVETVRSEIQNQCNLGGEGGIEDAFPCAPLPAGLMALGLQYPRSYVATRLFRLSREVNMAQFQAAWSLLTKITPLLRSRIVSLDGTAVQAVIQDAFVGSLVASAEPLKQAIMAARKTEMGYGSPLSQCALAKEEGDYYFIWTIHHAIFDGWSMGLLLKNFHRIYDGLQALPSQPYVDFVRYTQELDKTNAARHWTKQLEGASRLPFPAAETRQTASSSGSRQRRVSGRMIHLPRDLDTSFTKATTLRAAWALLLLRYCETDDVCFGMTVSGRYAPVPGIDTVAGPTIATIPVRVRVGTDRLQSIRDFLDDIQTEASESAAYEHYGLRDISRLSSHAKEACDFGCLFVVQPAEISSMSSNGKDQVMQLANSEHFTMEQAVADYWTYPLILQASVSGDDVELMIFYETNVISQSRVDAIHHQLDHIIQQLATKIEQPLHSLDFASAWDVQNMIEWNQEQDCSPHIPNGCNNSYVHSVISAMSQNEPSREAIVTSSRLVTYREMNHLTDILAARLQCLGVGPECLVPNCFEKSEFAVIAMLATLKAGGVYVPLDPSHPRARREAIVAALGPRPKVILASRTTGSTCAGLADNTVEVSEYSLARLSVTSIGGQKLSSPSLAPDDAAYILFTSGSTGKPKGVVVTHSSLYVSLQNQGRSYGFNDFSRMLQFSSYTFDAAIMEILLTLFKGGTVCIPTEEQRMRALPEFINGTKVNIALLTPSVCSILHPYAGNLPTLNTLLIGGEAITQDVIDIWQGKVNLINAYGPAEVCISCISHRYQPSSHMPLATIGRGFGCACWIVEPDGRHLTPIGCVGELVIQSHTLARGYLNDGKRTNEVFFDSAEWLPVDALQTPYPSRFYRTGDLARYNFDGTMECLGRRDTQVKIRGQRIDVAEVETNIKRLEARAGSVAVELLRCGHVDVLAAFVSLDDCQPNYTTRNREEKPELLPITESTEHIFTRLTLALQKELPNYLIPSTFLPLSYMPLNPSGKTDRKKLHELVQDLSPADLVTFGRSRTAMEARAPTTTESVMLQFWSEVLSLPQETIGLQDNFYSLGGDSITVVSLSRRVKKHFGVTLGTSMIKSSQTTIEGWAVFVDQYLDGSTRPVAQCFDLAAELSMFKKVLPLKMLDSIVSPSLVRRRHRATVLITGASGYLGSELLRKLLRSRAVANVIAVVRAASPVLGLARVKETATTLGWWRDEDSVRLEIWPGDLSQPALGLTHAQWDRLSGCSTNETCVDVIIHNGAAVDWNADYSQLRTTNVKSTAELVAATVTSSALSMVYVSGGLSSRTSADRKAIAADVTHSGGYSQSKYVSEMGVQCAIEQFPEPQNRLSSVLPGFIIGTKADGVSNVDDYLWRCVAAAVLVNAYPEEPAENWMSVASIDTVASTIIEQAFTTKSNASPVIVPDGIFVHEFWDIVKNHLNIACSPVPASTWKDLVEEQMETVGEAHPFWAYQHFFGSLGSPTSGEPSPLLSQTLVRDAVKANLNYLQRIGFITRSTQNTCTLLGDVISRRRR